MPMDATPTKEEFATHERLKAVERDVQYLIKATLTAQKGINDVKDAIHSYHNEEMGGVVLLTFALCLAVGYGWSALRHAL
jgi:hypothetical protein